MALAFNRFVVGALAVGKVTRMAQLPLLVPFNAVNRFTMSATAGLFLFGIGHNVRVVGILLPRIRDERGKLQGRPLMAR